MTSSRISVSVADDRLTAFVTVRAAAAAGEPGGGGAQELQGALAKARVTAGIDAGVFERVALGLGDAAFEITDEPIARGTAVERAESSRFEPEFSAGIQPGHLREDGTIDFLDRELLKAVRKADVLGRVRPARAGTAGRLVDGTEIAVAPVSEVVFALGAGVEQVEGGVVRAARPGVVVYKASKSLDVVDQHVHQGPVDLRSGHLRMQGSLQVNGDVQTTFSVYASGDIEIRGSVDGGSVQAGGDVRVHGVRGERAMVCAEGNLSVHHAESATLYAGKLLQIAEAVHAQISAGRVEVSGKLRGGLTRAESSIIANEVGSPHGKETEVAVAEPFELPVENALRALETAKALRAAKPGPGDSSERDKGGKVGRVMAGLQRVETERLAERARRRVALGRVAFIQIGRAHPGVTVRVGDRKLLLEREVRSARFSLDGETGELHAEVAVK